MAKILVIDDDGIVRDALKHILSRHGHEVLTAIDGENGLLTFKNTNPDIVILDRELPRMSGFKVLKKIREISTTVIVIVLTGFDDAEGQAKYSEAGITAFLSKGTGIEPLLRIIKHALGTPSAPAQADAGPGLVGKAKVLVVDDEATVRKVLARYLSEHGYAVLTAEDGAAALDIIKKETSDIVLLDMHMPGKSGLETLRELHTINPKITVIMVTGDDNIELALECVRAGAADYIRKPLQLENLETIVMANSPQHC
jgi:DNA-binding response OmpR family regulator